MPPSPVVTLVASDPEHRPTEIGGAHDVERAAARTVARAIRRGLDVEVEHPRRGRDITDTAIIWGITAYLAPAILVTALTTGGRGKGITRFKCICITCPP